MNEVLHIYLFKDDGWQQVRNKHRETTSYASAAGFSQSSQESGFSFGRGRRPTELRKIIR